MWFAGGFVDGLCVWFRRTSLDVRLKITDPGGHDVSSCKTLLNVDDNYMTKCRRKLLFLLLSFLRVDKPLQAYGDRFIGSRPALGASTCYVYCLSTTFFMEIGPNNPCQNIGG